MKPSQYTTLDPTATTIQEVCGWAFALEQLHARLAPYFARSEPFHRVLAFLKGVLSSLPRKNGWQLAEYARESRPDGMQRLLSQAVWDTDGVRDEIRRYAVERLGTQGLTVGIDETSFPKQGNKSAGVQIQYCGTTGQVENCQVAVFLNFITPRGHTLIDRELYLPLSWIQDPQRCREAGIPSTIPFWTKCEQAQQMLERVCKAHLPIRWVVADCGYGRNLDLRTWLETHHLPFIMAVESDETVAIHMPAGRSLIHVDEVASLCLQAGDWQSLSMSPGSKGPRLFDWACVPVLHQWQDDGQHWLLLRRCLTAPFTTTYYLVFGPVGTTLPEMVTVIGSRWHVEEDFENDKDLGLDHYEVRTWVGWYRHVTLVMLAHAFLAGIRADTLTAPAQLNAEVRTPAGLPGICADPLPAPAQLNAPPALLPLSVPEIRHLLSGLIWPSPCQAPLALAWSQWRRRHQSRACFFHTKRRLNRLKAA